MTGIKQIMPDDRLFTLFEKFIQSSSEQTKEMVELKMEMRTLNRTLSNGPLGRICKKNDKIYTAVIGAYVPLLAVTVALIWMIIK